MRGKDWKGKEWFIPEKLEYFEKMINGRKWWFSVEFRDTDKCPYRCRARPLGHPIVDRNSLIEEYAATPEGAVALAESKAIAAPLTACKGCGVSIVSTNGHQLCGMCLRAMNVTYGT